MKGQQPNFALRVVVVVVVDKMSDWAMLNPDHMPMMARQHLRCSVSAFKSGMNAYLTT